MVQQSSESVLNYLIMFEKFLISIGLKQPTNLEVSENLQPKTVRPTNENKFLNEEFVGDVRVHNSKDEVEIKALRSFSEIQSLGVAIKDEFIVAMDVRDIPDQQERRRILDFVTGMAFMSNATMRVINKDGVYLIIPSSTSLSSSERERLQQLGLYRLNV
jgi:FtsZ-interacting cell division protein YlmF